ncbi:MAG: right-handed parallel beta-helix repeat-containing protein, partial [Planctomycetota bacterium]
MRNVKNLALFVLMPVLVSTAAVADIHYVNPGDNIQAAIDAAGPGDEIEVAPGTYTEAINFNGKAIRLYSSGGPDVTTIDGTGHYHVVQCISGEGPDTVLEGFTITGGNANGVYPDDRGGGMLNNNSSPTVTNCTFTGNTASAGGGMWNEEYSSPTVTNCTFSENLAGYGGGMHNENSSSPILTDCSFSGNSASRYGGGMYSKLSSPTVTNCTFSGNSAGSVAGGTVNVNKSKPNMIQPSFLYCMGGGMCNIASSPTVTNCTFSGNSTEQFGGGMYNQSIGPALVNCTFIGNTARDGGGGMCNNVNSNTTVTNCTFSENSTGGYGGGMYNFNDSNPTIANCILWNNTASLSGPQISGLATVTYSDVQGGWSGTGNIDADPLFADADLRLSTGSPCINAGSNAALPPDTADLDSDGDTTEPIPLDLDGNARIFNGVVDMGAYESQEVTLFGWV